MVLVLVGSLVWAFGCDRVLRCVVVLLGLGWVAVSGVLG